MIRFDEVGYQYDQTAKATLRDVSLGLDSGSFYYLCGPSGAGKTTLFKMMYMDLLPTRGDLTLFGKNTKDLTREDVAMMRRRMGVVFQDFRLLNHLSVKENVALPLIFEDKSQKAIDASVEEILDWVGLGDKLLSMPNELSGGEKQRVAIARAVINRPEILIADEPTGNVDDTMAARIMHLFTELNKHGTTVLLATHDKGLIENFPNQCLFLEDGALMKGQI